VGEDNLVEWPGVWCEFEPRSSIFRRELNHDVGVASPNDQASRTVALDCNSAYLVAILLELQLPVQQGINNSHNLHSVYTIKIINPVRSSIFIHISDANKIDVKIEIAIPGLA
jgi:hypothetical protein